MNDSTKPQDVEVLILGAGVCGIAAAVGCRNEGIENFVMIDRAEEVGGTWYHNRYPGCAVDIPSHVYSFSFAPNPDWSRIYSTAGEVQSYLAGVVDTFDLRRNIELKTELLDATWSEEDQRWIVTTNTGVYRAQAFISAAGPLHEAIIPAFDGLEEFEGRTFHSSQWPEQDDLDGQRVVVIGTGASAIQFVPQIQPRVEHMTVLQRTPSWVMPKPDWNVSRFQKGLLRRVPFLAKVMRWAMWAPMDAFFLAATRNQRFARFLGAICSWHMRRAVKDPATRKALTPTYAPTCKRLGFSNDYYGAYAHDNVELLTVPAASFTKDSVITTDGRVIPADVVIFGTGFQTLQHHPMNSRVHGRDGVSLEQVWDGSPTAHMGTTVSGFPNSFVMFGPNIGTLSGFVMAEAQTDYIMSALRAMKKAGFSSLDVRKEVQDAFVAEMDRKLKGSTFVAGGCSSYYLDDSQGRASLPWPSTMARLRRDLRRFELGDYAGVTAPR